MTLRYSDDGPSDKPCVLFLHAFPYHAEMWDGQRAAISDIARTVALDVRGVREPHAHRAYMLEHLVDDVLALLDALHIERAVLCGLSMGGYIALRTAERAPSRVRALFLADTQAAADDSKTKIARAEAVRSLQRGEFASFVDVQLKRALSERTHQQHPEYVSFARHLIAACDAEGLAHALVALASRTDVHDALAAMTMPARVVVGECDKITPVAVARALATGLAHADFHVIAGAGHISNLEAPNEFDQLLRSFVAGLPAL